MLCSVCSPRTQPTGAPHLPITSRLSTTGVLDEALVAIVWNELIERFGSQKVASSQQLLKLRYFPTLKSPILSEQLYGFADLCYITASLSPHCPDLRVLDFAVGLIDLVRKLPTFVQHLWDKLQFEYASFHHQEHPPFVLFAQFLHEQAAREA